MYNKRELKKTDRKQDKRNPFSRDMIYDPRGQWDNPGENTRIPGGNITMQGVPYQTYGVPYFNDGTKGQGVMMQPGQDYIFKDKNGELAKYVDEFPKTQQQPSHQMPDGTWMPGEEHEELDLTEEEIQAYRDGGYVVEELPKAQNGLIPPSSEYKRLYGHSKDYGVGQTTNIQGGDMFIDPNSNKGYFDPTHPQSIQEDSVPEDRWNTSRFLYDPQFKPTKVGNVHFATYDPETGEQLTKGSDNTVDPETTSKRHKFKAAKEDITNYYEGDLGQQGKESRQNVRDRMQEMRQMKRANDKMGGWDESVFASDANLKNMFSMHDEYKYSPFKDINNPWIGQTRQPDVDILSPREIKKAYTKFQKAYRGTSGKEARQNSREALETYGKGYDEQIQQMANDFGISVDEYKKNYKDYKRKDGERFEEWETRIGLLKKDGGALDKFILKAQNGLIKNGEITGGPEFNTHHGIVGNIGYETEFKGKRDPKTLHELKADMYFGAKSNPFAGISGSYKFGSKQNNRLRNENFFKGQVGADPIRGGFFDIRGGSEFPIINNREHDFNASAYAGAVGQSKPYNTVYTEDGSYDQSKTGLIGGIGANYKHKKSGLGAYFDAYARTMSDDDQSGLNMDKFNFGADFKAGLTYNFPINDKNRKIRKIIADKEKNEQLKQQPRFTSIDRTSSPSIQADGGIVLDLTEEEITKYKNGGYIVEYDDIPKAQGGLEPGTPVSESPFMQYHNRRLAEEAAAKLTPTPKKKESVYDPIIDNPAYSSTPSETTNRVATDYIGGADLKTVSDQTLDKQIKIANKKEAVAKHYWLDRRKDEPGFTIDKAREQVNRGGDQSFLGFMLGQDDNLGGFDWEGYYNEENLGRRHEPWTMKAFNPNDLNHTSFGRPENPTFGDYAGRAWDIVTNPFDSFNYSVKTGDVSNMPWNYNRMEDLGYVDPMVADNMGSTIETALKYHPTTMLPMMMLQGVKDLPYTVTDLNNAYKSGDQNQIDKAKEAALWNAFELSPVAKYVKPGMKAATSLGNKVNQTWQTHRPVTKLKHLNKYNIDKNLGTSIENIGQNNLGVHNLKKFPGHIAKFEDIADVGRKLQLSDYKNIDFKKLMETVPDNSPIGKVLKQFEKVDDPNIRALIMNKLEGMDPNKMGIEDFQAIKGEHIGTMFEDINSLRDQNLAFDYANLNYKYDPETGFKMFDIAPYTDVRKGEITDDLEFIQDHVFGAANPYLYGDAQARANMKQNLKQRLASDLGAAAERAGMDPGDAQYLMDQMSSKVEMGLYDTPEKKNIQLSRSTNESPNPKYSKEDYDNAIKEQDEAHEFATDFTTQWYTPESQIETFNEAKTLWNESQLQKRNAWNKNYIEVQERIARDEGRPLLASDMNLVGRADDAFGPEVKTPTSILRSEVADRINAITGAKDSGFKKRRPNPDQPQGWQVATKDNILVDPVKDSKLNQEIISKYTPEDQAKIMGKAEGASGINFSEQSLPSVTFRRNPSTKKLPNPWLRTPRDIMRTTGHETAHTGELIDNWIDSISQYDDKFKYFTPNPNTELGRRFKEAMITPAKTSKKGLLKGQDFTDRTYRSSPSEFSSEVMAARLDLAKVWRNHYGDDLSMETVIQNLQNPSDELIDWMFKAGDLNKHFKRKTTKEEKRELFKLIPVIGAAGLFTEGFIQNEGQPEYRDGGSIETELSDEEIALYRAQGYKIEEF